MLYSSKRDVFKHEEEATKIVELYKNFEEGKNYKPAEGERNNKKSCHPEKLFATAKSATKDLRR